MTMTDSDLQELLDREAARINAPEFIPQDPVQFPRRFSKVQDIEIAGLLAANIAWGNRKMICRDADRILNLMDNDPYNYVMDQGYRDLDPDMNLHRTFFARHLQQYLAGLRAIYKDYPSLDAFAQAPEIRDSEAPAWALAERMQQRITEANGGVPVQRCLPYDLQHTALKRLNMALRWFVRDDGIVDMGVWKSIPKSKLFIPLDVHVGNVARDLGLLVRKANDRKSVKALTAKLREWRPDDPALYDFALFGIGVTAKTQQHESWAARGSHKHIEMKHTFITILTLLAFVTSSLALDNPKREFRGAWLHVIGQTQWQNKTTAQAKEYIVDQIDKLQRAGCNAVIFQVRPTADAVYKSDLEPWSAWLTGKRGKAPNPMWDPMEFAIQEAHKRGMEFHAWLNPYRVTSTAKEILPKSHISNMEPQRFSVTTVRFCSTPPIRRTGTLSAK